MRNYFKTGLGWHDTQIHNPNSFMTPNLGALAKAGITLLRHHTYKFCSPTRRSILSGRFPVHITGVQAPVCSNYLPLKFTLLPEKLKLVRHTADVTLPAPVPPRWLAFCACSMQRLMPACPAFAGVRHRRATRPTWWARAI